ncbi:hypothetical protein ACS0TY_001944 [Phlomoides rotata]
MDNLRNNDDFSWLCAGDLNEVMYGFEKFSGVPRPSDTMEVFRSCLERCGLEDLGFEGNLFTWTNKQAGRGSIQERLDRGVSNVRWQQIFHFFRVRHLT